MLFFFRVANSCAVFFFQAPSKWCSLDYSRKERHGFCEIHVRVFLLCDSSEWRVTASGFSIARLSRRDSDWCALQLSICSSFLFSWCGGLLRFWRSISSLTAYADSLRYDRYAWTVEFWNFFNRQILEISTDRHMKVCEKTVWFWKSLHVQSKVLVNWDLREAGIHHMPWIAHAPTPPFCGYSSFEAQADGRSGCVCLSFSRFCSQPCAQTFA